MKFAYYPGCSLHATAREYDLSTRAVCDRLGIELKELPDWNCCGATSAHSTNHFLSTALPARNLAIADEMGLEVAVPCAACYQRLRMAQNDLARDPVLREKMEAVTGRPYKEEGVRVKSLLELLAGQGEALKSRVVRPLDGLKVACYYGCLLLRPPAVSFDDPEHPSSMDGLLEICGAEPIDWGYKTECCGASLSLTDEDVVLKLTRDILAVALGAGAECLVVACPLCHSNLDGRQGHVNKKFGTGFQLPVLYFTQVLGLAMGARPEELGMNIHFVSTDKVFKKCCPENTPRKR
ncbi:MAG: CoB--CoM heterodisulfide reductase iron-sulfur subunit B family protein [Bacillota bacterium]|uniref:CoB--CoM heterodisulfide reductase iron-sulfur subunit B family protein n=1 Tax=Desulforudis sp. DRI-14 TaxID=3459793 RepID=UPI0034995704